MIRHVIVAVAAVSLLFTVAGCNEHHDGDKCYSPGAVYGHGNTRLSCGQDGKWHR